MNDYPKIQLSPFEEQLVTNSDWLLTKNAILEKIKTLLSSLQDSQQTILAAAKAVPEEVLKTSSKITRGENYLGLPWIVLDQPRQFEKENIFAIRTMFWWGHFFSTTLQLSGVYKNKFSKRLADSYDVLRKDDFHVSNSLSPWDHHFGANNYTALREMDKAQFTHHLQTHAFIKLAKKISLDNWNTIDERLQENFQAIIHSLS